MKNYADYKKKAKRFLKQTCELREELACNLAVYSRSDDVLVALDEVIFHIGSSVCPSSCFCIVDFCEWIKKNG